MRQLSLYEAFAIDRPLRRHRQHRARAVAPKPVCVIEDEPVCYVCYESTTETCQCPCRATVHAECLLTCVRRTGRGYCTICLGPIANLKVRRWRRISRRISVALVMCGAAVCYYSVYAAVMVGQYVEEQNSEVALKYMIQGFGALIQGWVASRLFLWLIEKRDAASEHAEYEYA